MEDVQLLSIFEGLSERRVINSSFPNIITYYDNDGTKSLKTLCFANGSLTEAREGVFYELHRMILENIPACKVVFQPRSHWGCVWAALGQPLPPMSMTHTERFFGSVPCTGELYLEQINGNLAKAFYDQIIAFYDKRVPYKLNAVLLDQIGPLLLGDSVPDVIDKAIYLEEAAKIAYQVRNVEGITYRHMHFRLMEKFYTEGLDKKNDKL